MTQRKYTNRRYLDALEKKVLIFDGAMGTSLQVQNLTAEHFGGEQYNGCNAYLVMPWKKSTARLWKRVWMCSNRLRMAEYGLQDRIIEIDRAAASLARPIADEYSVVTGLAPVHAGQPQGLPQQMPHPRFAAGFMGPSGKLPSSTDPEFSNVIYDELIDSFREQAVGWIQGGVDLFLIETSQDILEVKAALTGIHKAFSKRNIFLPIQAQVTLDTTGRMRRSPVLQFAILRDNRRQ